MRWSVAVLLVAGPLGAQVPIPPVADTLSIWIVRGTDTMPVGRQLHEFRVQEVFGTRLLRRVIFTDAMLFGPRIDTLISNLDTEMPVRYISATPGTLQRVEIAEGRARGRVNGADGAAIDLDAAVPDGSVHAANVDLALRRRLLPVGSVVTLPLFIPSASGSGAVHFRVEGVEVVGTERAWRIRTLNLANDLTLWISQRDRLLLRQTMVGPNGVQVLFDRRALPPPPARP